MPYRRLAWGAFPRVGGPAGGAAWVSKARRSLEPRRRRRRRERERGRARPGARLPRGSRRSSARAAWLARRGLSRSRVRRAQISSPVFPRKRGRGERGDVREAAGGSCLSKGMFGGAAVARHPPQCSLPTAAAAAPAPR